MSAAASFGFSLAAAIAAAAAAIACAGAVDGERERRRPWLLLSASALLWVAGSCVWVIAGGTCPPVAPTLAFMGSWLLAAAAATGFPGVPHHLAGRARTLVDGLIVAGSLLIVAWIAGLDRLYGEGAGSADFLALALALTGLTISAATVVMWTRAPDEARPALAFLGGGLSAIAVASCACAYREVGGDASWATLLYAGMPGGWLLIARGAGHSPATRPAGEPDPRVPTQASVLIPSIPVALGVLAAAIALARDDVGDFLIWSLAAVALLIIARQVLALLENIGFWRRLEGQVRRRTRQLDHSEARFRSIVQHSSDVIAVVGKGGELQYLSPSTHEVVGFPPDQLALGSLLDLVHRGDAPKVVEAALELAARPGESASIRCRLRRRDGEIRHVEAVARNLVDDPVVGAFVINIRDITERIREEELTHRAFHDSLTGLANRALFLDRLEHGLGRRNRSVAVLFIDLDGFKAVNDEMGHEAGDLVLQAVGERLKACVRPNDTVARLGGDEFTILIEDLEDAEQATLAAERVVGSLRSPIKVGDGAVTVRASVGIATTDSPGQDATEILRRADSAMYQAKGSGRGYLHAPRLRPGLDFAG